VSGVPVTRDDVVRAAETIRGRVQRTPLLDGSTLAPGLSLKAELLQHTGSFKVRGVVNRLAALDSAERERGVAGASAGNHAIALAWGAAAEGLECVVFSWTAASPFKLDRARALGAHVDVEAEDPSGAFVRLEEHLGETGRVLVHPFDDPLVMAGQGTVGLEILEDRPSVDVIVVPVGGAGLVAGIAAAVAPRGVRVVGVEPDGAASLDLALDAGKPVAIAPQTRAGGLDAPYAGRNALAVCRAAGVEVVRVSDEAIEEAMRRVYADAKLACEPAGAAAVAAVLGDLIEGEDVVAVVSGGNVGPEIASGILAG
jgi:threonine dehydratase